MPSWTTDHCSPHSPCWSLEVTSPLPSFDADASPIKYEATRLESRLMIAKDCLICLRIYRYQKDYSKSRLLAQPGSIICRSQKHICQDNASISPPSPPQVSERPRNHLTNPSTMVLKPNALPPYDEVDDEVDDEDRGSL